MHLKIVAPRPDGIGAEVYLDGKRLSGVTNVDVSLACDDANKAVITFYPTAVHVEGTFEFTEERPEIEVTTL